jgi:hypothetical protein
VLNPGFEKGMARVEINFFYHRLNLACGLKFHRLK